VTLRYRAAFALTLGWVQAYIENTTKSGVSFKLKKYTVTNNDRPLLQGMCSHRNDADLSALGSFCARMGWVTFVVLVPALMFESADRLDSEDN
jgi:hypothetical protein